MTILRGRELTSPMSTSVDVVVIGSGAGGAVVARELARAGRSVIVLEEGGYHPPKEYASFSPSRAFSTLAREAGLGLAVGLGDTPIMSVLAGKCVGGSSVLTGGVCFRIPDDVLHDWSTHLGLGGMTPDELAPVLRRDRARHVGRDRARVHALALDGALRRRRGASGHPDEEPAPQHIGLQRRVALQLRVPERREDERRHLDAA